jgi:Ni/Co efflux regulator RcnB
MSSRAGVNYNLPHTDKLVNLHVEYRLQPSFYGSRYYISDYGMYNLRAPSRWQQWIRYGNDLLLVNTRTGRVLQVVHYQGW